MAKFDFEDYTNILAATGVITWEKASEIIGAIQRLEDNRETKQQVIENKFWEDEGRYGSS